MVPRERERSKTLSLSTSWRENVCELTDGNDEHIHKGSQMLSDSIVAACVDLDHPNCIGRALSGRDKVAMNVAD